MSPSGQHAPQQSSCSEQLTGYFKVTWGAKTPSMHLLSAAATKLTVTQLYAWCGDWLVSRDAAVLWHRSGHNVHWHLIMCRSNLRTLLTAQYFAPLAHLVQSHINVLMSIHVSKAVHPHVHSSEMYLAAVSTGVMWRRCFEADFFPSVLHFKSFFSLDGLGFWWYFGFVAMTELWWEYCWLVWGWNELLAQNVLISA